MSFSPFRTEEHLYLRWNGGQSGRVWQKKTNSFSSALLHHTCPQPPCPHSSLLSVLSTPRAAEGHVSHVGACPSPEVRQELTALWGWGKSGGIVEAAGMRASWRGLLELGGLSEAATVQGRMSPSLYIPSAFLTSVLLLWFQSPTPLGEARSPAAPVPGRECAALLSYLAFS